MEVLVVDGRRIMLKLIFKKWNRQVWTKLTWHKKGTGGGCL